MAKKKYQQDPDAVALKPKGQLYYPRILEPDNRVFSKKKNKMVETSKKDKMKYSTGLIMDADDKETKQLIKKIEELQEVAKARATAKLKEKYPKKKKFDEEDYQEVGGPKKLPFKVVKDEAGEPTGDIVFNLNRKAFYKKDDEFHPLFFDVFDGKGNKITNKKLKIGNGSIARVNLTAQPYCSGIGFGVSLRMEAVKLLKLEEFKAGGSSKSAADYGFDEDDEDAEFDISDYNIDGDDEDEKKPQDEDEESDAAKDDDDDDDTDDGSEDDDEEDDEF